MFPRSLLHGTSVGAGGTLVACGPVGPWLRALAGPAHTLTPPAAQQAHAGHAGVGAPGAVAVFTLPVRGALAEAAVTHTVAWERRNGSSAQNSILTSGDEPESSGPWEILYDKHGRGRTGVLEGKNV